MKYTKIISLLLCLAMICSFALLASCNEDEGDTDVGGEVTTDGMIPPSEDGGTPEGTGGNTDSTTAENETPGEPEESYETDTMSSAECFEFAAKEFFAVVGAIKNGFMPEIFDSESQSDGGNLTLTVESLSLFGSPILNNFFSLGGGYAMNENGFISEGAMKNESTLEYQLCITPEGTLYVRFPQIDENTFIGLDTGAALGDVTQTSSPENISSTLISGSIFDILSEVFDKATDKLISEDGADITVLDNTFKGARKLNFKYVMTSATAEAYGVSEVNVALYVAKGTLVRAEFDLAGIDLGLSMDLVESNGKLSFAGTLTVFGEKAADFVGEQTESSGNVTFSFNESTEMGNMGISLSYDRSVNGNITDTDYAFGITLSVGSNKLTVAIPIHTKLIYADDGTVSFSMSIDTVKDKIPQMLADVRVGFEITRLPENSETSVTLPEFTDENTLYVNEEEDREALNAYFESMKEQFPDIKDTVLDILKLFGFNTGTETTYLEGTYAPSGISSLITLTFEADGTAKCSVLGFGTDGTYVINGNEITLDFGEGHTLTGTFSFENKDTSIVINGTEYLKK